MRMRLVYILTAYFENGYGKSKTTDKIRISKWSFNGIVEQFIVITIWTDLDSYVWWMELCQKRVSTYFCLKNALTSHLANTITRTRKIVSSSVFIYVQQCNYNANVLGCSNTQRIIGTCHQLHFDVVFRSNQPYNL